MSKHARYTRGCPNKKPLNADGTRDCACGCGQLVARSHHKYFSEECRVKSHVAAGFDLRGYVFERDKGICAACGTDTTADLNEPREWIRRRKAKWDADHIIEVYNGGKTELSNLQTLCRPCHKAKTKKLAQDRARARKPLVGIQLDLIK